MTINRALQAKPIIHQTPRIIRRDVSNVVAAKAEAGVRFEDETVAGVQVVGDTEAEIVTEARLEVRLQVIDIIIVTTEIRNVICIVNIVAMTMSGPDVK